VSERGTPLSAPGFSRLVERAGTDAGFGIKVHAHMLRYAMETSKEMWFEAEANRLAGEVALISPEHDAAKAQTYFQRALAVARQQQAKSWELRAAMGLARLWRDQGKAREARELSSPVYGWFTEGFDTRDLKEAKTLSEELAA
jgi:predicted ATPase